MTLQAITIDGKPYLRPVKTTAGINYYDPIEPIPALFDIKEGNSINEGDVELVWQSYTCRVGGSGPFWLDVENDTYKLYKSFEDFVHFYANPPRGWGEGIETRQAYRRISSPPIDTNKRSSIMDLIETDIEKAAKENIPNDKFQEIKSHYQKGDYDITDVMLRAYQLGGNQSQRMEEVIAKLDLIKSLLEIQSIRTSLWHEVNKILNTHYKDLI